MRPPVIAAFATLALAGAAQAQDGRECRNGGFPSEQDSFGLAEVRGAGRLPFLGDTDGCPDTARRCPGYGYVVPGDRLLTGRSLGPYVCAFFPGRRTESAGWVARDRLSPLPIAATPPASAWVGRWREGDNGIRLTLRRDGSLRADGGAYWPSRNPPPSVRPGGPNLGSLAAQGRSSAGRLHLDEGEGGCAVDLWLVGAYLVARDNMRCGGMNVSFSGVYRR